MAESRARTRLEQAASCPGVVCKNHTLSALPIRWTPWCEIMGARRVIGVKPYDSESEKKKKGLQPIWSFLSLGRKARHRALIGRDSTTHPWRSWGVAGSGVGGMGVKREGHGLGEDEKQAGVVSPTSLRLILALTLFYRLSLKLLSLCLHQIPLITLRQDSLAKSSALWISLQP